jgi:hypothetical protein
MTSPATHPHAAQPFQAALATALAGRPEDFAAACRAALEHLERSGEVVDAQRALRDIAIAFADPPAVGRSDWLQARCQAPNCAGHRTRA